MLLSLGQFIFSLSTVAYHDMQRKLDYKHPTSSRVGLRDAAQFAGVGDECISLNALVSHEFGSYKSLAELEEMAAKGEAYVLVEGTGRVYGQFVITSLTQSKSIFFADGLAKRIDFAMELKRVDSGEQIDPGSGDNDWPALEWFDMELAE